MIHFLKLTITNILFFTPFLYASTQGDAIKTIANYTQSSATLPTLLDYYEADINNVGTHNIDGINDEIASLSYIEVDTQSEIQEVVDEYNLKIYAVLNIITNHILNSSETKVADAGNSQSLLSGSEVVLDGSASTGVTYAWELLNSTPSGFTVTLTNPNTKVATFTATEVEEETTLTFILRVTDVDGNIHTDTTMITFRPKELIINEVSSAVYTDSDRWLEVYNPSAFSKNISAYTLRSISYDGQNIGLDVFTLPDVSIAAGDYLIIKPNYAPAFNYTLPTMANNKVIMLHDTVTNKYPVWFSDTEGFLELLKDGKTIDFITFGHQYEPMTVGWSGTFVPVFSSSTEIGKSIARSIDSADSDTQADWSIKDFPTYGGINDVTCNIDDDHDGIPDCSEVSGSTYVGMDLYAYGARTNQKDIFIEVDYVDSTNGGALPVDEGIIPQKKALEKVANSFANNGYSVHFDVGDLFAQNGIALDTSLMDLGGGNEVPYALSMSLGCTNNGIDARSYKAHNMQIERKQIFYYMLFGTSQEADGSNGSSGCAELLGNDSLITLGGWNLTSATQENTNELINTQAGTVMHEFGHNLGLQHGGDSDTNHKPNYLSVMNYMYQLTGLSTIGTNEGDRYYDTFYNDCSAQYTPLTNAPWESPDNFIIDYSHGHNDDLNERLLFESNGLGNDNSLPVDFNCNGNASNFLTNYDLNRDGSNTASLTDNDDWGMINIIFANTIWGNAGSTNNHTNVSKPVYPTLNDYQPVAKEYPLARPIRK